MGERRSQRPQEIAALREGIDLGLTLIDTAEMYGEGGAERVIAEAVADCRDRIFLVSKVYPHHASRADVIKACERSLQRLQTNYLDLYLLHWRGGISLDQTFAGFHALKTAGKIREFGVSNFDRADMEEAIAQPYGNEIAVNQVLYNLMRRGIEWDLLPWCQQHQIPIMAYSPLEQGRLLQNQTLGNIAQRRQVSPAQVAIAWLLRQDNILTIPKSATPDRIKEHSAAREIQLPPEELKALDQVFPPPTGPVPLEML